MAEAQILNPEDLANQLYGLLIPVTTDTSKDVIASLIRMLRKADNRMAGRALDLIRVGFSTETFQAQGEERPPYQYTKNFHLVWEVVYRKFTRINDNSAFADVHPFHFVTLLMEFFHTKANIRLYARLNGITDPTEARKAYFEIVWRNLKIDTNNSKLVLEVATRKNQKRISGLHWDLIGGEVGEDARFFIPPEYLREKWITVNINGVSKQSRKKGIIEFFEFPVVLSHFSHHSLDTLSILKLASIKEVQFVCDGNIKSHSSQGDDDPVNVLYCTTGMGFPRLRTLVLSEMPLECITFSDISSDTLTTLNIINLSLSSCEGIWNDTENVWEGLSLDRRFTKLSHVEVYGNAFMIDKATCPKLKHLEFGGHVMSGVPGDENRYFMASRFPLLSVDQEETLTTLIVRDCKLSSFETMHKIGEESQNIPRFSKLNIFKLSNLFLYEEKDLKTSRYITYGDKGPTLVEFNNVTVSVGFQGGADFIGAADPHIPGPLSQRTVEMILRRMVRCTKLTILNMPEVRSLFKVTQHMNNLDVLTIGNIGVEEGATISKEVATRLQYIHRTPVKDKLRGVRFTPDIEVILHSKSKKNKRKKVDAKVSAGKVTSPARRPSNQIIIISDDDEDDLEVMVQGPTQEETRSAQESLLRDFSRCLGSPNRGTQDALTRDVQWMHPDILTDTGWNGQLVAWEGACVDWISGKESDTIFVEELVGEDQAIEQQPPEEGFDIGVSFPVIFNFGAMGSETRWLSMTEDTGVNPDEAYVTFYNDTFTYRTAFLSEDQLNEHYSAYQGDGPSPEQRTKASLKARASLFSSIVGQSMNLELNLRRLPRHLGWILAGADVNVEANIDQIGIPSVTDSAEFAITIGPYHKPGEPGEHFDKGYKLVPSQESATMFDIIYIDDNLRQDMSSPADDNDNTNFVFHLGGLELDYVGNTGVLEGFTISIPCLSLMKIVGLQSLEILCFTTEEQNEMITNASRLPQVADDEEDEDEEWQEGQDELELDLVQQAANRSGIEATPLDIKMRRDGVPNDPPVRVRVVPNDATMYKVARGILSRTRNTVLGAMVETPVSDDDESGWNDAELHESRHFTPSALILCYFVGRGMLEILNMPDIKRSPMFGHFSIVYNAHWVPLMRWCTQAVPKSLGHTLDTGFQKHQDTERLMSIASGQWSGKQERQDRRETSLKIYGRGFVALKNLVEIMSELMEDTSSADWGIIDTEYKKAFALYLTLFEIVLQNGDGDSSRTKRSMTTATNKALKEIKTFFESIWGSLEEQVEIMLENPSPGVAPTILSFGLQLAEEEEEDDVPTQPSSPASPGVSVVQKSSTQRAPTVTETVQDAMGNWDAFVVKSTQQQKSPEQADTKIILHLVAQEEIPGLAISVVAPPSPFTTPQPKKTRRRRKAAPKKNVGAGKVFSHQTLTAPTDIVPITPPPTVHSTRATKRRAQKSPTVSPEQLKSPQSVSTKNKVLKRVKAQEDSPTSVMIQTPTTPQERGRLVLAAIARRETVSKKSPVRSLGGIPQKYPGRAPPPVLLQDVTRRTREDELRDKLIDARDREIDLLRQLLAAKTESEKEWVKKRRRDSPPDSPPLEFKKPPPDGGGGFFSTGTNAKICANCGDEAESRCSKCKAVFYCGRECQRNHYAKHVHECK